jgi:simple sugar transport system permease protein
MSDGLLIGMLAATVAAATPLLLAGLGEIVVERSGVLNLGIEGMMLVGAMAAFASAALTSSATIGLLAGVAAAVLLGGIFAALTISIRTDQIVTGLAIVVLGDGLSRFFGRPFVGVDLGAVYGVVALPGLAAIPFLGPVLFRQNWLVYLSYLLVLATWYFLYRTHAGLALWATGEKPSSVDVAGRSVFVIRYGAVLFGSAMAGLGGAFLSLGYLHSWVEGITAGRGWIALALVILASWHPVRLLAGAYIFGFAYILAFQSQTMGGIFQHVSTYIVQMFPYVLAIVVLATMGRRSLRRRVAPPAALTLPYVREQRG